MSRELQEAGDAVGTLLRVQCIAARDPTAARAALDGLDPASSSEPQAEAVRRWRAALR